MLTQLGLGLVMTTFTVCCGALVIVTGAVPLRRFKERLVDHGTFLNHLVVLTLISVWLIAGMLLITLVWAVLLQSFGVFDDFETSLYFSMISFTTVGYGDIVPPQDWRLLSAFVSVGGFLLFGLNTAFVFEVLRRMRGEQSASQNQS